MSNEPAYHTVKRVNLFDPSVEPDEEEELKLLENVATRARIRSKLADQKLMDGLRAMIKEASSE